MADDSAMVAIKSDSPWNPFGVSATSSVSDSSIISTNDGFSSLGCANFGFSSIAVSATGTFGLA